MTPVAICSVIPHRKKSRGALHYLRQVNAVNGGDYEFIGFVVLCVCLFVCAQWHDVIIIMMSLRRRQIVQPIVCDVTSNNAYNESRHEY